MTTTATMRHLSALGNGPALVVFNWLAAAGQPMQQNWIESMTDLSDKTVAKALKKLVELQYIVEMGDGWAVTTAQQGVLGDVLAALPGERDERSPGSHGDGISDSGRLEGQNAGDITAGEGVERGQDGNSDSGPYGVGGVGYMDSINHKKNLPIPIQHHQHQENENGISDSPERPFDRRARAALLRVGCWPKQVNVIIRELDAERGLLHVLGWVAYSQHPDNGVDRPGAIVRGHLVRHEEPGGRWTPPFVCETCGLAEGRCQCSPPIWHVPVDFDELAFEPVPTWGADEWLANRWRCTTCGGHPCRCHANEEGDDV